jgi:hypothetical protein
LLSAPIEGVDLSYYTHPERYRASQKHLRKDHLRSLDGFSGEEYFAKLEDTQAGSATARLVAVMSHRGRKGKPHQRFPRS